MNKSVLQNIKGIAKSDFLSVEKNLQSELDISASVDSIHFSICKNVVTATCDFKMKNSQEVIAASIEYMPTSDGVYADSKIDEVSNAVLSAASAPLTTITAADEDEEQFVFDDESFDVPEDDTNLVEDEEEAAEDSTEEDTEELEDPEDGVDIQTDNNIAGHYIAECNRCHGVFISALMESDQHIEFISGICPLCEKESDQYIKWVINPVE